MVDLPPPEGPMMAECLQSTFKFMPLRTFLSLLLGVGKGDVPELELPPEGGRYEGVFLAPNEGLSVDDREDPPGG